MQLLQYGSIKPNNWRLQSFIDQQYSGDQLSHEEHLLWLEINNTVNSVSQPPQSWTHLPNSKLLGYGWEWAVYEISPDQVIKVARTAFAEVNDLRYLENAKHAYEICQQYLPNLILHTTFERIKTDQGDINTLKQPNIPTTDQVLIDLSKLNDTSRQQLLLLSSSLLNLVEKYDWMPDLHLEKKNNLWSLRNVALVEDKPIIYDFTTYYDVWRLYPARTQLEKKEKGNLWKTFKEELT
ncbi:MAG: hypothetical protein ACEQSA_02675 [Weeksellaceae bacterium]